MPTTTTSTQLAYDSVTEETHLNVVLEDDVVARNLTITRAPRAPHHRDLRGRRDHRGRRHRGQRALKGTLTAITTDSGVPEHDWPQPDVVNGNASVTTGAGNDFHRGRRNDR